MITMTVAELIARLTALDVNREETVVHAEMFDTRGVAERLALEIDSIDVEINNGGAAVFITVTEDD